MINICFIDIDDDIVPELVPELVPRIIAPPLKLIDEVTKAEPVVNKKKRAAAAPPAAPVTTKKSKNEVDNEVIYIGTNITSTKNPENKYIITIPSEEDYNAFVQFMQNRHNTAPTTKIQNRHKGASNIVTSSIDVVCNKEKEDLFDKFSEATHRFKLLKPEEVTTDDVVSFRKEQNSLEKNRCRTKIVT